MTSQADLAHTWLDMAESDLGFAELGLREGFYTQVCFTCQQAAEKALKAYLFAQGESLLRTHVLPRLLRACESHDARFVELTEACAVLTAYYTDTRYPETSAGRERYDSALANQAVILAGQVILFTHDRIVETLNT